MLRRIDQITDFIKSATAEFLKSAIFQLDLTQLEDEVDAKN